MQVEFVRKNDKGILEILRSAEVPSFWPVPSQLDLLTIDGETYLLDAVNYRYTPDLKVEKITIFLK